MDGPIRLVSHVYRDRDGCCLWMTGRFGINLSGVLDTLVHPCIGGDESPVLIPYTPNGISTVNYFHPFKSTSFPLNFPSAATVCRNRSHHHRFPCLPRSSLLEIPGPFILRTPENPPRKSSLCQATSVKAPWRYNRTVRSRRNIPPTTAASTPRMNALVTQTPHPAVPPHAPSSTAIRCSAGGFISSTSGAG